MRFRDTLKFSLELFLPERAALAFERFAFDRPAEVEPHQSASTISSVNSYKRAQGIIEELDSSRFGGPSFGPQTIALMSLALEEAQALLPQPIADDCARSIAAAILKVAEVGERDPVRLRTLAMSELKLEGANVAAPPAMPSN
jgi:hypothetical protein